MPNVIIGNPGIVNGSWNVQYVADPKVGIRKTATIDITIAAESTSTGGDSILATSGLPQLYGFYDGMWCNRISLKDAGPGKLPGAGTDTRYWVGTFQFDSELDTNSGETNPLNRPVIVSRDSTVIDERIFYDAISGQPLVNAAGDPLYVTGPYVMPVFNFTRFEAYPYPDAQIFYLTNSINFNPFRGAPVGTALMLKVRTNEVTIKDVRYEQVNYTVQFRIDRYNPMKQYTWREYVPDAGPNYLINVSTPQQKKVSYDRDGVSRGTIHPLNPDGSYKDWNNGEPPNYIPANRQKLALFPTL